MYIIRKQQDLAKLDIKILKNYNYSFYVIYLLNNNYTLLQLFKTNDNKFQWFFIGKPYKMENKFSTVKEAFDFMLSQKNFYRGFIVPNRNYSELIQILESVEHHNIFQA